MLLLALIKPRSLHHLCSAQQDQWNTIFARKGRLVLLGRFEFLKRDSVDVAAIFNVYGDFVEEVELVETGLNLSSGDK